MSGLSDALGAANTAGLSARAIARAAKERGHSVNHDTAARYLRGEIVTVVENDIGHDELLWEDLGMTEARAVLSDVAIMSLFDVADRRGARPHLQDLHECMTVAMSLGLRAVATVATNGSGSYSRWAAAKSAAARRASEIAETIRPLAVAELAVLSAADAA